MKSIKFRLFNKNKGNYLLKLYIDRNNEKEYSKYINNEHELAIDEKEGAYGGKYDHYDQQAVRKWWFTGGKDPGRTDGGMVL